MKRYEIKSIFVMDIFNIQSLINTLKVMITDSEDEFTEKKTSKKNALLKGQKKLTFASQGKLNLWILRKFQDIY